MKNTANLSLVHRSLRGLSNGTFMLERGHRWWMVIIGLAMLLLGAASLILHYVDRAESDLIRGQLIATRESNSYSLQLWLNTQEAKASRIVEPEEVAIAVEALSQSIRPEESAYGQLLKEPQYQPLLELLTERIGSESNMGWLVLDTKGSIVIASDPLLVGRSEYPLPDASRNHALAGSTIVSSVFRSPIEIRDRPEGTPLIASLSPIFMEKSQGGNKVANHQVVGVFALLLDPAADFSHAMEVSRSGETGESYVVDAQGRMISRSRFEPQLRSLGLLSEDEKLTSILEIEVRDPGASLVDNPMSQEPKENQPLTVMAVDLLRGGVGERMEPYRDYRGVSVVGAWRWLAKYQFGLATEVDVAEAFRPVSLLRRAVWGLAVICLVAILALGAMAWVVGRFQSRVEVADLTVKKMGQYSLLHLLGSGGMGAVYLGRHTLLRRPVAIKVLRSNLSDDDRSQARFEREVQLTSQLTSPHTVSVYDYGTTSTGEFFYVMEYLEGVDLAQLIERFGPQPPGRVIHIMLQICESLAEAHSVNLIHRDVKPANVILCTRGTAFDFVKLVDFGLVKQEDSESLMLTRTGAFAGTPMYMSPEAVRDSSEVTRLSDLYSLSAVAYWLLTGRSLFDAGTPMEVCMLQVRKEPAAPSSFMANVPRDLEALIMRGLSKTPIERPQSALEYARLLRSCQDADRWSHDQAYRWWTEKYLPSRESEAIQTVLAEDTFSANTSRTGVELDSSRVSE